MKPVPIIACMLVLLVAVSGCGKSSKTTGPDVSGAQAEVASGDQALAGGDYAGASGHYQNALAKDAGNLHAQLGAGVTAVYLIKDDPQVDSLLVLLGGAPVQPVASAVSRGHVLQPLGLGAGSAPAAFHGGALVAHALWAGLHDPLLLSDVQGVIRTRVMTRLQYAEDRMNVIEQHPEFQLVLPPSLTHEPANLEVDLGEVRALDAAINEVQGWLGVLVAYDFDTPADVPDSVLLAPGSAFGTLHAGGAALLAQARLDLLTANDELDRMVTSIQAETDDQSDDVIPQAALAEPGFQSFRDELSRDSAMLLGPADVDVRDYLGNVATVRVDLRHFFTTPITDFKAKAPAVVFDPVTGDPVVTDPLTFPDPTFNQLFPNMTNDLWRALIGPVTRPRPGPRA